jgi:hypothetical protein
MPLIATFYGILIRMNFNADKKSKPHFQAQFQKNKAIFSLKGNLIVGKFPEKQSAIIKAWALLHYDELLAEWELAISKEDEFFRIEPLR